MATGRTTSKFAACYLDYWNLAGNAIISGGPFTIDAQQGDHATWGDAITGGLPVSINITPNTLNCVMEKGVGSYMDMTATPVQPGAHLLSFPIGIRAAPAQGDPVFCCYAEELGLVSDITAGMVTFNMNFGPYNVTKLTNYRKAWGVLLHSFTAAADANTATGVDNGAATAAGGYMVYHIYTGTGTATVKVQDAATNTDGSFADLVGATTGVVDTNSTTLFGIVQLGATAAVRQFLRWQIVKGTATSVTFALSFIRG